MVSDQSFSFDTAGFDDEGVLGQLRVEKTALAAKETDIALVLFTMRIWWRRSAG
ncbi:MAG: hypothetical protein LKE51_01390 [Selenomonas sp.]|jgi:predicted GTPase|nr:hypothetical protein [Selenomonas sp.]